MAPVRIPISWKSVEVALNEFCADMCLNGKLTCWTSSSTFYVHVSPRWMPSLLSLFPWIYTNPWSSGVSSLVTYRYVSLPPLVGRRMFCHFRTLCTALYGLLSPPYHTYSFLTDEKSCATWRTFQPTIWSFYWPIILVPAHPTPLHLV